MSRSTRLRSHHPWGGLEILIPALLVLVGQPALAAGTLAALLLAFVMQSRMLVRAEQQRHKAELDYAHTAVSLGSDPSPVITALHTTDPAPEPGAEADGEDAAHPERRPVHPWY